jgi:hypothetical protein
MNAEDRRVSKPSPEQIRELLEPDGIGRLERLEDYVRRCRRRYVFDSRTVLFDVRCRTSQNEAILEGSVGVAGLKEGLVQSLSELGLTVRAENLKIVPPLDVRFERYALVCVPYSFLCGSPEPSAGHTDELLLGEPLLLMGEFSDGYWLVQGPSGYLGWIRGGDIHIVDRETWRVWHREERVIFDREEKLGPFSVPAGAELPIQEGKILLPDQTTAPIPVDLCLRNTSPTRAFRGEILRRAESLLGREYVWAGRGGEGLDCSGFVHTVYAGAGIYLPRDADQQHLVGRVSGTPDWREDLAPGDLLFFTGPMGNIVHVALSTGGQEFIHAKGGEAVMRGSFDPESNDYDERLDRCFLVAKRVVR